MIKNAKFISSAADLSGAPSLAKSEVAFLGRSNVGKSSLINALCHAKIAKSSATPGKTRLINFFDVEISANFVANFKNNGEISVNLAECENVGGAANSSEIQANLSEKFSLVFVDLPGFGYAKVGKKTREAWDKNLDEFLRKRVEIRLFVHLRDARHFELNFDEEISAYLKSLAKCDQMVLCVFTKADKLNQSQRARLKAKFPNALLVSSTTRRGLKDLERVILDLVLGGNLGENLVNLRANSSKIQANLNRDLSPCKSKAQYDKILHAKPENSVNLKSNSHKNSSSNLNNKFRTSCDMDCHADFLRKSHRNDDIKSNSSKIQANLNGDVSPYKSKAQHDKNLRQISQISKPTISANLSTNLHKKKSNSTSKVVDCHENFTNAKFSRNDGVKSNSSKIQANLNGDVSPCKSKAQHDKNLHAKCENSANLKSNSHKNSSSNLNNKFRTSCDMDCRGSLREPRNDGVKSNFSEIQANLNRDVSPCKSKAQHDKNSHENPENSANLKPNSHQISQISKPKISTNSNKISRQKSPNSTKARHDNA